MTSFRDLNRRAVVAIPAKNEAERLAHCLRALGEQLDRRGRPLPRGAFGVVVLANDCDDDTAAVARAAGQGRRYELRVIETRLPRPFAHAGGARRAAMDLAEAWLAERPDRADVILTTDADSLAAPDWLSANLKAFDEGADAVLGRISLDEEGARLPAALHARGKLEAVYEDLLTELCAQLDPQDENPWPHHATISGASLAIRRDVYLGVGRLPRAPLGEDKALVAALRRRDARIRFAPDVTVVTSGRIAGRALGGVADTLRLRSADPAAPCDETLERCTTAYRRALWRGRLRRVGLEGEHWREALRVPGAVARRARAAATFGAAWERIEAASPGLVRRPLKPAELPRQIELATRLLTRLQATLSAHEDVEPIFRSPRETDDLDAIL
jgi:cellulose synthase/poly-beta-1,6-N-acetylglucosamine synthase-like glycosyltransferase